MGAMSGSASTEIDAPIEAVWAIVQDVESAPAWQRGIDSMQALERDGEGRATRCDTVTDMKVKVFDARLSFDYEPPARLSWVQERGDLKSMTGSWQLEDLGDGRTRATYSAERRSRRAAVALRQGRARGEAARACSSTARPAELKARAERRAIVRGR